MKCKYYPPPINGGTTESAVFGGTLVTPSCNKAFEFATAPCQWYQCLPDGVWFPWSLETPSQMPWPDCTGM